MNSGKDTSIFKFLLIARIIRDKGVFEYIEAAKILQEKFNDIEFLVIGETEVNNRTSMTKKEILKFDHDRVIQYLGKTDNIIEQLAKVDCVVLPSYREGSPRSLMEASSMGVPVIATNVPGCKDIVDHNVTGLLCKVRDSADLANKMEIMVNLSEVDRKKMGDKARAKMINEYDESIVINRYLSAINTILK
jgi:glycosyltransferase involved in cell wall biosynthesis